MRGFRRPGRFAWGLALGGLYAFLLAAPAMVIYYAFSPTVVPEWPPGGATLRWFANAFSQPRLVSGLTTSILVAAASSLGGLLVGVPAALGLERGTLPGRRLLAGFFLSPLTLPGLVLAVGILMALVTVVQPLVGIRLVGGLIPLVAVHLLVTLPWVIRTVSASLETLDGAIEEAARGLGASPFETLWLVTLPAVRPAVVTAGVFAFIVSFGNFALSLFFASGRIVTLPIAIYEYVDQFQDPTVAAVSTLVIVLTTVGVTVTHWLTVRMHRRVERHAPAGG